MKFRKASIILVLFFIGVYSSQAQVAPTISDSDFKPLIRSWQGSLTYLDYTTKKPYTMPADMVIEQLGTSNTFLFKSLYPDEPKANSVDTVIISKDGTMLDDETVKSKKILDNGNLEIITERSGIDGNDKMPAILRYTYIIGQNIFIRRKDVQFVGKTEFINRHEYSYKIKKS